MVGFWFLVLFLKIDDFVFPANFVALVNGPADSVPGPVDVFHRVCV
jgi:hypothetical protein